MMSEKDLNPCPWCGGKPLIEQFAMNPKKDIGISCVKCGVSLWFRETREESIKAWNNRQPMVVKLPKKKESGGYRASISGFTQYENNLRRLNPNITFEEK